MPEYIDKEKYCAEVCKCNEEKCDKSKCPIWNAPAADVAPVVHGKWIHLSGCDVCSVCNYKTGKHEVGRNFCPEYGAKMDLEDDE